MLQSGRGAAAKAFHYMACAFAGRTHRGFIRQQFSARTLELRRIINDAAATRFDQRVAHLALVFIMWPEKHGHRYRSGFGQALTSSPCRHAAADERDRGTLIK